MRPNLLCAHMYDVYIRVYEEKKGTSEMIYLSRMDRSWTEIDTKKH